MRSLAPSICNASARCPICVSTARCVSATPFCSPVVPAECWMKAKPSALTLRLSGSGAPDSPRCAARSNFAPSPIVTWPSSSSGKSSSITTALAARLAVTPASPKRILRRLDFEIWIGEYRWHRTQHHRPCEYGHGIDALWHEDYHPVTRTDAVSRRETSLERGRGPETGRRLRPRVRPHPPRQSRIADRRERRSRASISV